MILYHNVGLAWPNSKVPQGGYWNVDKAFVGRRRRFVLSKTTRIGEASQGAAFADCCHLACHVENAVDGTEARELLHASSYLSKTRHALVPPKPKELDMTRETSPSWRSVRMCMPSDSSTISPMLALSARKPSRIMRSE